MIRSARWTTVGDPGPAIRVSVELQQISAQDRATQASIISTMNPNGSIGVIPNSHMMSSRRRRLIVNHTAPGPGRSVGRRVESPEISQKDAMSVFFAMDPKRGTGRIPHCHVIASGTWSIHGLVGFQSPAVARIPPEISKELVMGSDGTGKPTMNPQRSPLRIPNSHMV